jgi:hypothetical protein
MADFDYVRIAGARSGGSKGLQTEIQIVWSDGSTSWELLKLQSEAFRKSEPMMAFLKRQDLKNSQALKMHCVGRSRIGTGQEPTKRRLRSQTRNQKKNKRAKSKRRVKGALIGPMVDFGSQQQSDCMHHALRCCVGRRAQELMLPTSDQLHQISVGRGIVDRASRGATFGCVKECLEKYDGKIYLQRNKFKPGKSNLQHLREKDSGVFLVRLTLKNIAYHIIGVDCLARKVMCGLNGMLDLDAPDLCEVLNVRNWGVSFQLFETE